MFLRSSLLNVQLELLFLQWIWRKQARMAWAGLIWLRVGTSSGLFERGNEPLGPMKSSDAGNILTEEMLTSQEELCPVGLDTVGSEL
jgi:hypothetical protein